MVTLQAADGTGEGITVLGWALALGVLVLMAWASSGRRRASRNTPPQRSQTATSESAGDGDQASLAGSERQDVRVPLQDDDVQWFYAKDRQRHGPVSAEELLQLVETGVIHEDDLLWRPGWTSWRPAANLGWLFAAHPPDIAATAAEALSPPTPTSPEQPSPTCVRHSTVDAAHRCSYCGNPMCDTCAFSFDGGLSLCPDCAVRPRVVMTPTRRKQMVVSYVCAACATIAMAAMFTPFVWQLAATEAGMQAIGVLLAAALLGFSITGIVYGSLAKGKKAPPVVLGAWIWNLVLAGVFFVLSVIGNS